MIQRDLSVHACDQVALDRRVARHLCHGVVLQRVMKAEARIM